MTRTAVLIGTNTYDDPAYANLRSPTADVDAIDTALRDNGHFDERKVLIDPTYAEASSILEEVLNGMPDDLVFISISGHGVKNKRGRLHLALRDTSKKLLASTGLSAEKLQRMLEDSRVNSKLLLLDCCYSGAFADGFTTRDDGDEGIDVEREFLNGEGTYVLAAAGSGQEAKEGDNSTKPTPSPFSAAVARALAGEGPDGNGDGWIDTSDLYQYVHRQVDSLGGQRVTGFSLETHGSIRLARRVDSLTATPASPGHHERPAPTARTADRDGNGHGAQPRESGNARNRDPHAPLDVQQWKSLFSYYHSCLTRQSVLQQLPDVHGTQVAACDMGSEELLSGAGEQWSPTGKAATLAANARRSGQMLRYGYPAVLFDAAALNNGGRRDWKIAPLLVMDLEVSVADDGEQQLVPVSEPMLNTAVLTSIAEYNPDELNEFLTWFEADWAGTGVAGLGDKARSVCERLDLPRVHDLVPGELRRELDLAKPYRKGAQNVAVLHRADRADAAVQQLVRDLDVRGDHALKTDRIPSTALAALGGDTGPGPWSRSPRPVITGNSNSAQEEILHAAMERRLTVATGAPGTGKSELITSVVTTAVADGQSVLVASTNNTAVDEVVNRANALLPGADLVVRTGNADRRKQEPDILTTLRNARFGATDVRTAAESLDDHEQRLSVAQANLGGTATAEHQLAVLSPVRQRERARLPEALTPASFPDAEVDTWASRIEKALENRWSGWWYRWRVRRRFGIRGTDDELVAVLRFLHTEREWRHTRRVLADHPAPESSRNTVTAVREGRREDGSNYLVGNVAAGIRGGQDAIDARLQALNSGATSWKGIPQLLAAVRAWATTSRSVRSVFPPNPGLFDLVVVDEASQCTIPDLIPLLYRAKRALVIGDPHQLQPVNTLEYRDDRRYQGENGLDEQWLEDRSLLFTRNSAYHAAAAALSASGDDVLWLDEHYRCHPDIVTPVNRRFYGNRLAVRTRTDKLASTHDPALRWIDVRGAPDRPGGFSCRNQGEAQRVIELLRELWRELPDDVDIGVVTPFAAQLRELRSRLGERAEERIRCGTIHTFQGGERDVIVVSPTAATGADTRPANWAVQQQNLWNVAVTRAKSRLYVVGDRGYWSACQGLLADLANARDDGDDTDPSRDEARTALFGALRDRGSEPRVGTRIGGYHCDLYVPTSEGGVAVLVDWAGAGDPVAPAPGRCLQRTLDRVALFGTVSGLPTLRVPAWRCLTEPDTVAREVVSAHPHGNAQGPEQPSPLVEVPRS
ncbi:AAA domain-containing protein [Haloactinospora alba]|uniref:AAA domain-containing protein n=1 Tax=Haloactinospora alba TaxID=405555 RepID=A0A543NLB7_9ACTN|nr:AAA domain-containing protein [Haloactinospora alba]TQN32587.1 AAA domain-containing protein [Haloactinospora alba]